eukprot:TRINITY_DN8220_c0_g1_i1.p1 TRINITY_DN8220_c0_g1~~TRINITY_DN8220_c0_g1_i1.p1  ORF type:complete len:275 (+),score=22.54 TRINITY_DN8220_c0_g1_i1:44-868(+)
MGVQVQGATKQMSSAMAPTNSTKRRAPELIKIKADRPLRFFGPPGEVVPGLWVGSMEHASTKYVEENGFDSVFAIMRYSAFGGAPAYPKSVEYYNFPYCDNGTDLIPFAKIAKTINECLKRNLTVLVHCKQGISRSVSTVMAYLCMFKGHDFDTALQTVRDARPAAAPKFTSQIRSLCNQLETKKARCAPFTCPADMLGISEAEKPTILGPNGQPVRKPRTSSSITPATSRPSINRFSTSAFRSQTSAPTTSAAMRRRTLSPSHALMTERSRRR